MNHTPKPAMTVLYDSNCQFCINCRNWLISQKQRIPLMFIPINSELIDVMYPTFDKQHLNELVVINHNNDVYYKDSAFIMCLYALSEYYEWSFKLSNAMFRPLLRKAYLTISNNRGWLLGKPGQYNDKMIINTLSQDQENEHCTNSIKVV